MNIQIFGAMASYSMFLRALAGGVFIAAHSVVPTVLAQESNNRPASDIGNRERAPCPPRGEAIVIAAFGQSNSANHADMKSRDSSNTVYNFYKGYCYRARDPMLGATGDRGSLWISFGQKLALKKNRKVVAATFGVGGSPVARWADPQDLGAHLKENLRSLRQTFGTVNEFLWVQGENDDSTPPRAYARDLSKVIQVTKSFFPKSTFNLSSTTHCAGRNTPAIAAMQKKIATAGKGVRWLGDTDKYRGPQWRSSDDCHFNPAGVEAVAEEFARRF